MDAAQLARQQEKEKLLARLAELMVEEQVEEGVFVETPHFSVIERTSMRLGRELSREAQQRAAREVAAQAPARADCPTCGSSCSVTHERRTIAGIDGPVELLEPTASCDRCRRSFFPSAGRPGNGQPGGHPAAGPRGHSSGG